MEICTHTFEDTVHTYMYTHTCILVKDWVLGFAVIGCCVEPLFLSLCQHSGPSLARGQVLYPHQEDSTLAGTLSDLLLYSLGLSEP